MRQLQKYEFRRMPIQRYKHIKKNVLFILIICLVFNFSSFGQINTNIAKKPLFSKQGGFYKKKQVITLSANSSTAVIRYTTDGSTPNSNSNKYSNSIIIDSTTVIRAQTFDKNNLPSKIITHTYFIYENFRLPVISISTNPDNLWDNKIGMFVDHGIERQKEWRRPVYLEFFENDINSKIAFSANADIKLFRTTDLSSPQKSFNIFIKEVNDSAEYINHQIFPDKHITKFKSLILHNINEHSFIFSHVMRQTFKDKINIDFQGYRFVILFLNGKYYGIYSIEEDYNKDYFYVNYNIDNIDMLSIPREYKDTYQSDKDELKNYNKKINVLYGDAEHYNKMLNFITANDISLPKNYYYVKTLMDVDNFTDYIIAEIFTGNIGKYNQSIKCWRPKTDDGKWRWLIHDLNIDFYNPSNDSLLGMTLYYEPLFQKLLENSEFKNKFIKHFEDHLNLTFTLPNVMFIICLLKINLEFELPRHVLKWGLAIKTKKFNAFSPPIYAYQNIIDRFKLSGTTKLKINIYKSHAGKVKINDMEIPPNNFTGVYFKDIPIKLQAIPKNGYKFVGWKGISKTNTNPASITLTSDTLTITAVFEPETSEKLTNDNFKNILPAKIFKNTILTEKYSPYIANNNVTVCNNATLTVEPGVEIQMADSCKIIVYGNLQMNGTKNKPIYIKPKTNGTYWHGLSFCDATVNLSYVRIKGAFFDWLPIEIFTSKEEVAVTRAIISSYNSDITFDNIKAESNRIVMGIYGGNIVIKNSSFSDIKDKNGDFLVNKTVNNKIRENGHLKHMQNLYIEAVESVLIENCDIYGRGELSLDFVKNGIIRNNRFYVVHGNDLWANLEDAIDISRSSCLIQGNTICNAYDKGISIGEMSHIIVKENLIMNCGTGISVKDGSYALIDHNTFYGNGISIASESIKSKYVGGIFGGKAEVTNTIMANSLKHPYFCDKYSTLSVSYSLSNTDTLKGKNNVFADPLFVDESIANFRLQKKSPCINSASPTNASVIDNTCADIGAYCYNATLNDKLSSPPVINFPDNFSFKQGETKTYDFSKYISDKDNTIDELILTWSKNNIVDIQQNGWEITFLKAKSAKDFLERVKKFQTCRQKYYKIKTKKKSFKKIVKAYNKANKTLKNLKNENEKVKHWNGSENILFTVTDGTNIVSKSVTVKCLPVDK